MVSFELHTSFTASCFFCDACTRISDKLCDAYPQFVHEYRVKIMSILQFTGIFFSFFLRAEMAPRDPCFWPGICRRRPGDRQKWPRGLPIFGLNSEPPRQMCAYIKKICSVPGFFLFFREFFLRSSISSQKHVDRKTIFTGLQATGDKSRAKNR
jgi:hypothetical protein